MAEQEVWKRCPFGGEMVTISRNWYPPGVDLHCHCPVEIRLSVAPKHDSINSYDFDTAERELRSLWNSRALLATEQGAPQGEQGWLLEKGPHKGCVWYISVDQMLTWTDDPSKALRLARREDAEALTNIVEDCERIIQHAWPAPPDAVAKK